MALSKTLTIPNGSKVIAFKRVADRYGWLGNMSSHRVHHDGAWWPTTEHLFQALRFSAGSPIREMIRNAPKAIDAKNISEEHKSERVVERLSDEDLENMRLCLRLKLKYHEYLKHNLLETKKKFLIEDVSRRDDPNDPWGMKLIKGASLGKGTWTGQNLLGNLWMELRDQEQGSIDATKEFFDF